MRENKSRRRWHEGLEKKAALGLGSLALTLSAAEVVARIVLPPQQVVEVEPGQILNSHPGRAEEREQNRGIDVVIDWSGHRGVRLNPNLRATIRNHTLSHRDIVIETNSLGLRHPELGPKSEDEFRILVLGDSITFCDYVPFKESVTYQLERALSGSRKKTVVINAGLPGAGIADEFFHYLEIRKAVEPDLVLLGMYLNDVQSSGTFYAKSLPQPLASSRFASWVVNRFEVLRVHLLEEVDLPEIDPEWALRFRNDRNLHPGDMWHTRDGFDYEIYNARSDFGLAWNPQSWVIVRRVLRTLALSAREANQPVAVFLFPVHIQVKGSVRDFRPQQSFRKMCASLGLPCFDLVPALRDDWQSHGIELYYDHCHMTPHGNMVAAAALAQWLVGDNLVPFPPTSSGTPTVSRLVDFSQHEDRW